MSGGPPLPIGGPLFGGGPPLPRPRGGPIGLPCGSFSCPIFIKAIASSIDPALGRGWDFCAGNVGNALSWEWVTGDVGDMRARSLPAGVALAICFLE